VVVDSKAGAETFLLKDRCEHGKQGGSCARTGFGRNAAGKRESVSSGNFPILQPGVKKDEDVSRL
jgi:hypothetical protein